MKLCQRINLNEKGTFRTEAFSGMLSGGDSTDAAVLNLPILSDPAAVPGCAWCQIARQRAMTEVVGFRCRVKQKGVPWFGDVVS